MHMCYRSEQYLIVLCQKIFDRITLETRQAAIKQKVIAHVYDNKHVYDYVYRAGGGDDATPSS